MRTSSKDLLKDVVKAAGLWAALLAMEDGLVSTSHQGLGPWLAFAGEAVGTIGVGG